MTDIIGDYAASGSVPGGAKSSLEPGTWVVRENYSYDMHEVEKVMPNSVALKQVDGRYTPKRMSTDDILYSGTEAECRAVVERLTSSRALRDDDRRKADDRHRERVQRIVATPTAGNEGRQAVVNPKAEGE